MEEEKRDRKKLIVPLKNINEVNCDEYGISVYVYRLDLYHRTIIGNKWFKLKYNLKQAKEEGHHTLLSFGGAYSNHIQALAVAGKRYGFKTIGVIRGEEHLPLNSILASAKECGMIFHYMDRTNYRNKHQEDIIQKLQNQYGKFYHIPEGGTNVQAVRGAKEILEGLSVKVDYICAPCGTGGTLAGLIAYCKEEKKVIGFPVLKNAGFLKQDIEKLLKDYEQQRGVILSNKDFKLMLDYHFGGYAKTTHQLTEFIHTFISTSSILIEPVYTGKMFYGVYDLIKKRYFPHSSKILLIHTGPFLDSKTFSSKL